MTPPTPPPPPGPRPAPKTRPMLFLLGCSLVFFLVLLAAVGIIMFSRLRATQRRGQPQRTALPADWRERVRAAGRVPAAALGLATPRSDSGNAAAVLYGPRPIGTGNRSATIMRLSRDQQLSPDDSAAVRRTATDTTLDLALRAARMTEYRVVPLMVADTVRGGGFLGMRTPSFFPSLGASSALEGLTLRGYDRMRRGRAAQGEQDLRAAIGLGLMMSGREPTTWGARRGLRAVSYAATLYARGLPRRDSTRAAEARAVATWAEEAAGALVNTAVRMGSAPETVLVALVDTTLPFPFRAELLYDGLLGYTFRSPWRVFAGPGGAVWRRVHAFEQHPDADLAAIATATDSVLTQFERIGRFRRVRLMMRGP